MMVSMEALQLSLPPEGADDNARFPQLGVKFSCPKHIPNKVTSTTNVKKRDISVAFGFKNEAVSFRTGYLTMILSEESKIFYTPANSGYNWQGSPTLGSIN